jgi:hypothetical protein
VASDYIEIQLVGAGVTIPLSGRGEGAFVHVLGSTGFGMVPTVTRFSEGSGTGSTFLGKRLQGRALLIKVGILGASRQALEDNWQTIAGVLRDDDSKFQVVYPDEAVFELPVHYESGLEGSFAGDVLRRTADGWMALADVALTAPDPYWRNVTAQTFSLELPAAGRSFLGALARLPLSVSLGIQDTVVVNHGTVPASVVWTIRGPANAGTEVAIGGQGFELTAGLSASDVVTVDASRPGVPVVTLNGARDYGILAKAPKFPQLPAGSTLVHLEMPGAVAPVWQATGLVEAVNEVPNPKFESSAAGFEDSGGFAWEAAQQVAFASETSVAAGFWMDFTEWGEPWVSTVWEAAGDGVHLFVEFFSGDVLTSATVVDDGLSVSGLAIPGGTTLVRVGVGFVGEAGTVSRAAVIFQQTGYAWFDGDSVNAQLPAGAGSGYAWEGTPDASKSDRLVLEKHGGSLIKGSFREGKEVVV